VEFWDLCLSVPLVLCRFTLAVTPSVFDCDVTLCDVPATQRICNSKQQPKQRQQQQQEPTTKQAASNNSGGNTSSKQQQQQQQASSNSNRNGSRSVSLGIEG
jgi:hypothetical protein